MKLLTFKIPRLVDTGSIASFGEHSKGFFCFSFYKILPLKDTEEACGP